MHQTMNRNSAGARSRGEGLRVRRVKADDIPHVVGLDQRITRLAKPEYWHDIYARYGRRRLAERFFLIAEKTPVRRGQRILGFVIGEVRAWEFGSAPCGWVFAMSVEPEARLKGVGKTLLQAISSEFKNAGVSKMRTMVARDNRLHLLFFRSEGMAAGPYIQLEKEVD
jgi:GNAT superfamily N-acetyltransferase